MIVATGLIKPIVVVIVLVIIAATVYKYRAKILNTLPNLP